MGLDSVNLMQSTPKAAVLCEIMEQLWGCSRSLKVTDFDTDRKPAFDFVLVNNTNSYPISHHFRVITAYWSSLLTVGCLY